ncbi:restriction endonuclease subunit S [Aeromonas veronii]
MSAVNQLGKYQPYPAYQKSEAEWIGQLPSEWNLKRGKYVFHEINERSESGDEQLLSVSEYYGVKPRQDVAEEGEFLSRAESLVGYKKCQVDDLAMNIMLAWKTGLGVSEYEGIISPAYAVFRFYLSVAVPAYMHYLLRTEMYSGHFKTLSTGVIDSRLRLYPETFSTIEIVLPSVEEQRSIAAFLDYETARIDRLIAQQQRLIELLKEKRQAVISHAVTKGLNPNAPMKDSGVEWLGQVPEHWKVGSLRWYLRVSSGEYLSNQHFDLEPSESAIYPVIGGNGVMGYTSHKNQATPLVVGRVGALCGNVHLVDGECWVTDNALLIGLSSKISVNFAAHYLKSLNLNKLANQNTQPLITGTMIKDQYIALPPLHEQSEIVEFVTQEEQKLNLLVAKAEQAIVLMQERRTALTSAAVTGKIDLRGWTPPAEEVAA